LYKYAAGAWARINIDDAQVMASIGTDVYVDFSSLGLYRYNGASFKRISTWDAQGLTGAEDVLYADFGGVSTGGRGLYAYEGTTWRRVSVEDAESMGSVGADLYVTLGGSGVYRHARGVMSNDQDVDGDPLIATLLSMPSHGSVALNSDGTFSYTPLLDFNGTDSFTYKVGDGVLESAEATVRILVNAVDNLKASGEPEGSQESLPVPSNAELGMIVDEAVQRWEESGEVTHAELTRLDNVTFRIADLPGLALGQAVEDVILIDEDAAEYGWYVDETPADDLEFGLKLSELELMATSTSVAFGRMDLLTVVMHELGHVLGYEDLDPNAGVLMSGTLDAGTRRLNDSAAESPELVQMDRVPGGDAERASMLWGTKENKGSWLEDFLMNGSGGKYNPFDPTEKIKISIPGTYAGGAKKRLH